MSVMQTHLFYISIVLVAMLTVIFTEKIRASRLVIKGGTRQYELYPLRGIGYSIVLIILIIPLVQRNCGADTSTYYFNYIQDRIGGTDALFGYILAFVHRYISDPKVGYGLVSGITIIISVFALIKAKGYADLPLTFLAYLTSIYFYSYNYIRMLFAFSFILMGYSLCVRDKKRLAIIPFALSCFFHLSSVIVLVIHIVLIFLKKHSKLIILIGVVGLIAFILRPYYFLSLITIERYQNLIEASSSTSIGVGTIVRALPVLYIIWTYREKNRIDYIYTWIVAFAFANVAFSFLGYFVGSASRISNILLTFHTIFAVPYLVHNDDNKRRRSISRYIFIVYCILMYLMNISSFSNIGIVPYY